MTYEDMLKELGDAVGGVMDKYLLANRFKKFESATIRRDFDDVAMVKVIEKLKEHRNYSQLQVSAFMGLNRNTVRKMMRAHSINARKREI